MTYKTAPIRLYGPGYESNVKLKPCPFCGWATPELVTDRNVYYVRCTECGARGPWELKFPDRKKVAASDWNTREGE